MYTPVKSPRLPEVVAQQIEDLIVSQSLRPGDMLPPERELSRMLGVGRPVLRESLGVLAQRRLVKVIRGRGTFVSEASHEQLNDSLRLLLRMGQLSRAELCDARELLEAEVVARAAVHATPGDIHGIEQALAVLEANVGDPALYIKAEMQFHSCLAQAAHHKVFVRILDALRDFMLENFGYEIDKPESIPEFQKEHRAIAKAIKSRDAQAARNLINHHMEQVHRVAARLDESQSILVPDEAAMASPAANMG